MRSVKLACGAILLVGLLAAVAAAQGPVPTVAVSVGKGTVTAPAGPIPAGPTRLEVTRTGTGDVSAYLATLRAGVTLDQLRQQIQSDSSLALVFLEGSTSLSNAAPKRGLTVDLRPNATYVLVSQVGDTYGLTTIATTGTANGTQAPAPDATIRMVDYGFRGAATLPRNGVIRVANAGLAYHFTLAAPLRPGVSAKRINRAFRSGRQRAIGRVIAGEPVSVQDLISPGSVNDNEITFQRAGRYALVCFFGEHNRLGMYRIVRVR